MIIAGFILLIYGAKALITGASSLARLFNVPEIVIGLTIVALGTSAPEIVVNLISGIEGHHEVVFGNIIGSNNFNLFLVLGVSGAIYPIAVRQETVRKEIPFSLFASGILFILVNDRNFGTGPVNNTSILDGIILLCLFILFLVYVFRTMKSRYIDTTEIEELSQVKSRWGIALRLLFGLAGLSIGGKLVVDNAINVAEYFDVSEKMIGLTIVAAGTSLPELATTSVAAYKKKADMAIGNIIGSNLFNILLVLGLTSIVSPLKYNTVLNIDIFFLMGGTTMILLFLITLKKNKVDRFEAITLLIGFVAYMVFLFIRK